MTAAAIPPKRSTTARLARRSFRRESLRRSRTSVPRRATSSESGRRLSLRPIEECIEHQTSVHIFGLTGGIASGKSTVAARLRARGMPVIDADHLAREVLCLGSEGLRDVAV